MVTANRKGFSLIECLLAASIFAVGMVAVLQLVNGAGRNAQRSANDALAGVKCEAVLDDYLSMGATVSPSRFAAEQCDATWICTIEERKSEIAGMTELIVSVVLRESPQLGRFEMSRLVRARD